MNYVRDTLEERVRADKETTLVVLDVSEVSIVDMHAAEMLAGLADELAANGIKIRSVEAHSQVRDRLRSEGSSQPSRLETPRRYREAMSDLDVPPSLLSESLD
jgi:anti-anti-sigma regulatory factor